MSEADDLSAEYRREVRERLQRIEDKLGQIGSANDPLHLRVAKLEQERSLLIGALVVIQAIGALAIAFLGWVFHR
jgi:hypothetical protein